jgi:fatty acid desaturase
MSAWRSDDYSNSFAKVRAGVRNSRNIALIDFLKLLRPNYAVVYRDIAIGYVAIMVTVLVAIEAERWEAPFWVVAPITGLLVGFWIAYLQLFIHEGAHWNLAADRDASDRVCNRLISWWAGLEVSRYRRVHFQHHRALGTTEDSEISYFFPLNFIFFAKGLLGIRAIEVFLAREALAKPPAEKATAVKKNPPRAIPALHREMIFGALFHIGCIVALLYFGYWAAAAGWAFGVGGVFPLFGALRQMLEHRSEEARADVDYRLTDHGAMARMFDDGVLARTLGGAGFNRHLLHHWEPTVSYTRLVDLEAFLLDTHLAEIIRARKTTYGRTFVRLIRRN